MFHICLVVAYLLGMVSGDVDGLNLDDIKTRFLSAAIARAKLNKHMTDDVKKLISIGCTVVDIRDAVLERQDGRLPELLRAAERVGVFNSSGMFDPTQ
jgi:hypothetical protein